jgi:hypothetical protein
MTTQIANATLTVVMVPDLLLGYEVTRASRSVQHEILGGGTDVTMRPAAARRGTLRLLFASEAASITCELEHSKAQGFLLQDTERPAINMTYVVTGDVTRALDEQSRALWTVDIPFMEVVA